MSKKKKIPMTRMGRPLPPAATRVSISLFIPPIIGAILSTVAQNLLGVSSNNLALLATFLGGIGLTSMYLGMNWYGTAGMGLRGGRPFFAGAGFAFLGWVALLIVRFFLVEIDEAQFLTESLFPSFIYLLFFEAFAVQLWAFGLLFRSAADWRGGLTAAITSGLAFAAIAFTSFQESFAISLGAVLFFLVWGIFYGIIRLRTGSLIGIVLVQAMQSLTGWVLLPPVLPLDDLNFNSYFYTYMGIWLAILIWRLWPTEESDYRV